MTYGYDDVSEELGRLNEDYNSAPLPEPGTRTTKIPDGTYQAKIQNAAIKRNKKNGKLMMVWQLKVIGPSQAGAELVHFNNFDSVEKLGYLKKDLAICGMEMTNLATLESRLPELLEKILEIGVQTNGQYQNVYFNALVVRNQDDPQADLTF